jgi:hypothetical protein
VFKLEDTKGVIRSRKSKLRLFVNVLNLTLKVVLKATRVVVMRLFSLGDAPLGLFKFISDYLSYFAWTENITCLSGNNLKIPKE